MLKWPDLPCQAPETDDDVWAREHLLAPDPGLGDGDLVDLLRWNAENVPVQHDKASLVAFLDQTNIGRAVRPAGLGRCRAAAPAGR